MLANISRGLNTLLGALILKTTFSPWYFYGMEHCPALELSIFSSEYLPYPMANQFEEETEDWLAVVYSFIDSVEQSTTTTHPCNNVELG